MQPQVLKLSTSLSLLLLSFITSPTTVPNCPDMIVTSAYVDDLGILFESLGRSLPYIVKNFDLYSCAVGMSLGSLVGQTTGTHTTNNTQLLVIVRLPVAARKELGTVY